MWKMRLFNACRDTRNVSHSIQYVQVLWHMAGFLIQHFLHIGLK